MIDNKPPCRKCQGLTSVKLRRQIAKNNSTQAFWFCTSCKKKANSKFVTHKEANEILRPFGKTVEDLPVIDDYRENAPVCAVCGELGTEHHHWLPQAFVDRVEDHSAWPTDYLCKKHHDFWHETVTPYLPGRGHTDDALYTKEKYLWMEQTT